MSLSIVMPLLENCPDYQCHCVKRCEAGPALALCFAHNRTAMLRRALAWAEQAEDRAARLSSAETVLGHYARGYNGSDFYEGYILGYDGESDEYELTQEDDSSIWIEGKTMILHVN
jgi:hypothetical protein